MSTTTYENESDDESFHSLPPVFVSMSLEEEEDEEVDYGDYNDNKNDDNEDDGISTINGDETNRNILNLDTKEKESGYLFESAHSVHSIKDGFTTTPIPTITSTSSSIDSEDVQVVEKPSEYECIEEEEDEVIKVEKTSTTSSHNSSEGDGIVIDTADTEPYLLNPEEYPSRDPNVSISTKKLTNKHTESSQTESSPNTNDNNNNNTNDDNNQNSNNSLQSPWRVISNHSQEIQINSISFNHEKDCIAIGTTHGYVIRTVHTKKYTRSSSSQTTIATATVLASSEEQEPPCPNIQQLDQEIPGGVSLCEMLHSTSLLAIVKTNSPRTLTFLNMVTPYPSQSNQHQQQLQHQVSTKKSSQSYSSSSSSSSLSPSFSKSLPNNLCDVTFGAAIRHVELNRHRFFVLTADAKLHIFSLSTLQICKTISILVPDEEPNRWLFQWNATSVGAFWDVSKCLSTFIPKKEEDKGKEEVEVVVVKEDKEKEKQPCWLVCKSSDQVGEVHVYDAWDLRLVCKTRAHEHSIARIAIGGKGTEQKFATASIKGTQIRVFSLPQCEKLYSLWRGSGKCQIYSLAFDPFAKRVAVSASTGTIHLYKLETDLFNDTTQTTTTTSSTSASATTVSNNGTSTSPTALAETTITTAIKSPTKILKHAMKASQYLKWPAIHKDSTDYVRSYAKVKIKTDGTPATTTTIAGSNVTATNPAIRKGQSPPNIIAIMTSFGENNTKEEGEDCMIVGTMDGKLLKYSMDRKMGTTRLKDMEDLILDQEDVEDCTRGVVHAQVY